MATTQVRDAILLIGASGRTGRFVLRYLCAASVPVIACVRSADRLAAESRLASAQIAVADLERPYTLVPLIERAAHVIYLAGGDRRSLAPGAWQLEIDSLAACVEAAQRSGLPGRWISVGYAGAVQRGSASWAETRWRELKVAAEEVVTSSGLNYFLLRTGRITDPVSDEPRVGVSQQAAVPDAELPCNALGFLLVGAALAGAASRARATVRLNPAGVRLQSAVDAFGRLHPDATTPSPVRVLRPA